MVCYKNIFRSGHCASAHPLEVISQEDRYGDSYDFFGNFTSTPHDRVNSGLSRLPSIDSSSYDWIDTVPMGGPLQGGCFTASRARLEWGLMQRSRFLSEYCTPNQCALGIFLNKARYGARRSTLLPKPKSARRTIAQRY